MQDLKAAFKKTPSFSVKCWALKNRGLSLPHMLAGPVLLHYTGFLFFLLPSLSIFSSPAGQGSPAAARAHSSLPTFSSTCSYLAKLTGILKAWRRAICCPALHHFTPAPSSLCMHPDFFCFSSSSEHTALLKEGVNAETDWLVNPKITI